MYGKNANGQYRLLQAGGFSLAEPARYRRRY
jgi:hypothetical protein